MAIWMNGGVAGGRQPGRATRQSTSRRARCAQSLTRWGTCPRSPRVSPTAAASDGGSRRLQQQQPTTPRTTTASPTTPAQIEEPDHLDSSTVGGRAWALGAEVAAAARRSSLGRAAARLRSGDGLGRAAEMGEGTPEARRAWRPRHRRGRAARAGMAAAKCSVTGWLTTSQGKKTAAANGTSAAWPADGRGTPRRRRASRRCPRCRDPRDHLDVERVDREQERRDEGSERERLARAPGRSRERGSTAARLRRADQRTSRRRRRPRVAAWAARVTR